MTSDKPHQDASLNNTFDHAARSAHAASLGHLSPRVQAQLALRRRAALTQDPRRTPQRAWPMLALGSAAALTLAVGLFVIRGTGDDNLPGTAGTAVTAPSAGPQPIAGTATDSNAPASTPHQAVDTSQGMPADASLVVAATDPLDMSADDRLLDSLMDGDAPPADLLAAEFGTTDEAISLDALGFDTQDESPDFYLWLGSEDAQADVMESL